MTASTLDAGRCLASHTDWGGLRRLDLDGLSFLQYPADQAECGVGGLWIRILDGDRAHPIRLADPAAERTITTFADGFEVAGCDSGLRFSARFSLHSELLTWQWLVTVGRDEASTRPGTTAIEFDVVGAVDIALAPLEIVRINQYYVSQYLDLTPLRHPRWGQCLAVRQNMPGPRTPWALLGSYGRGVGWATDAAQLGPMVDGVPSGLLSRRLPNARLQHEHTLAVIADRPVRLEAGQTHRTGFFGVLVPDHPQASSSDDLGWAPEEPLPPSEVRLGEARPSPAPSAFATADEVLCEPVDAKRLDELVGGPIEVTEQSDDDWWEALADDGEVLVSFAKDRAVLRPHGQLLRTGSALTPDPGCLTTTVWLNGVFASHLTRGHVGRDPLLTATETYLGLRRSQGLRIFVRDDDRWLLLGRPSAWGLRPHAARWLYVWRDAVLEVVTDAGGAADELTVTIRQLSGEPRTVLVAAGLTGAGGTTVTDGRVVGAGLRVDFEGADALGADDGSLFPDRRSRGLPWLTVSGSAPLRLTLGAAAALPDDLAAPAAGELAGLGLRASGSPEVPALNRIVPWFTHDALVHYLSPRGLEQFSGGGWGTRDVCQGPVGLLTAYARPAELRDLLVRVYAAQHDRGDWPQAFEFLPPLSSGQPSAHGDVLFWPLLALGEYLEREGDPTVLIETVGFVGDHGPTAADRVIGHVERALRLIETRTVPGSPLPAYGHGDWNDSLQPADPRLAAQMASTWTAVLQVQALRTLALGLQTAGVEPRLRQRAAELADKTENALTETLLVDGLLAGYGVFDGDGNREEVLVHPRDRRTGLHYGALPWIHAISAELLGPDEARHHLAVLEDRLLAPDGARLFDAPPPYRGGPMQVFQRAEAATFWGREIGLLYTHAHLRYAEALARVGDASGLLRALCLVNPIGVTDRIAGAQPRQSTCYYSSSDAAFTDRYDAAEHYRRSLTGDVPLQGGWRVYSSGPGLFLRLLVECLLGVTRHGPWLHLDPVLDQSLDGLAATVPLPDRRLELTYHVSAPGFGVASVQVNGRPVTVHPLANRYRAAGGRLALADLGEPVDGVTQIEIEVGT